MTLAIEVNAAIVISIISLLFTMIMGLKGNKRTDTKDIEERTRERTELNCKLDMINSSTQDIKEQLFSLVKDVQKHGERITKAEEGIKRLYDRIENMEDRMNSREES